MSMRALWKGVITFGAVSVPVKLYTAVRSEQAVSFNLLHAKDKTPLKQLMVNSATGKPVDREHIVKGYEISRNRYVPVDEEKLATLAPPEGREIEVLRFVTLPEIDPRFFVRSYYLGPDNDAREYATLAAALEQSGRVGICRWVMRRTRYHGALELTGGVLSLTTLREAEQLARPALEAPDVKLDARELKTAKYLVEALTGEFDPAQYADDYEAELRELIARKAKGLKVPRARKTTAKETKSGELLELLEASVKQSKRAPAARRKTAAKTAAKTTKKAARERRGA
jgi:DNA end-binding protein Ku